MYNKRLYHMFVSLVYQNFQLKIVVALNLLLFPVMGVRRVNRYVHECFTIEQRVTYMYDPCIVLTWARSSFLLKFGCITMRQHVDTLVNRFDGVCVTQIELSLFCKLKSQTNIKYQLLQVSFSNIWDKIICPMITSLYKNCGHFHENRMVFKRPYSGMVRSIADDITKRIIRCRLLQSSCQWLI